MIPIVCFFSFLFGSWPLKWAKKSERFEFNRYFIITALLVAFNSFYLFLSMLIIVIRDDSINTNPQYLLIYALYFNTGVLILNRLAAARQTEYFVNELYATCGRTVESGRNLSEFWFRTAMSAVIVYLYYYKHRTFTNTPPLVIVTSMATPLLLCVVAGTAAECQCTCACAALADEVAAVNRQIGAAAAAADGRALTRLSGVHCRLVRLVRLFNDEYGVPIFLTTVNLLLSQIYTLNDIVAMVVDGETFEASYVNLAYLFDGASWTWLWFRFWWICDHVDRLTRQVHLTSKIMLEKDLNSFPENTRKLALDFFDQLLHRHVRISAWGFYDVNKELLFMVLGYQFGLCLICTQFSTSGIQLINNLSTLRKNYSDATES